MAALAVFAPLAALAWLVALALWTPATSDAAVAGLASAGKVVAGAGGGSVTRPATAGTNVGASWVISAV